MTDESTYELAKEKIGQIEEELKRIGRWTSEQLPTEKFENMGAFGENTMAFEQWIQFILVPRVHQIVQEKDQFPDNSMLATYAVRVFDGDPETDRLHGLLYEFDLLTGGVTDEKPFSDYEISCDVINNSVGKVSIGDESIPEVLYSLADVLPHFTGEDLESQLQTYDDFLSILSPSLRPAIAGLLKKAAGSCELPESKLRIEQAASSVANGGRAATPYDHKASMKKYTDDHNTSYPSA